MDPPSSKGRLVVHDYAGHPFQAQLSRALAKRGYTVIHQYCASCTSGQGSLTLSPSDPPSLTFEAISLGSPFQRYSPGKRVLQELSYAHRVGASIRRIEPDLVISSNVPLLSSALISWQLERRATPYVFWHQDIQSEAISAAARQRVPLASRPISAIARELETYVAKRSAAVVPIATTFLPTLREWNLDMSKVVPIENWAPVDEIVPGVKSNPWSVAMGLDTRPLIVYAGTLGLKHEPSILAGLVEYLKRSHQDDWCVLVVSEGLGREWLGRWKEDNPTNSLLLLDYQSYEALPDLLATADILLAILEPSASDYSVPSKILTYMAAGRPIVAVLPPENPAALMIGASGAGVTVSPGDDQAFFSAINDLLDNSEARTRYGLAGRRYAEQHFEINAITDRFEEIIQSSLK